MQPSRQLRCVYTDGHYSDVSVTPHKHKSSHYLDVFIHATRTIAEAQLYGDAEINAHHHQHHHQSISETQNKIKRQ